MNSANNLQNEIETAGISAIAAASKTPFKTAFSVTLGIGLARLVMFLGVVGVIFLGIIAYSLITK